MIKKEITVNDFITEVENSYLKYFTNSKIIVKLDTRLYKNIYVKCLLSNNINECSSRIIENDMMSISFMIDQEGRELNKDINTESVLPTNLQIKVLDNSYLIKPENQYLCYSRRKLNYRKTKGDAKKIINTLDKYFNKLHEELKKDIENNNIHDNHIDLLKSKLI